jgi:hypothetical protein
MSNKEKVKLIISLFKVYQPTLNIPEQIALLTMWMESCIEKEEYEMAGALKKQMGEIQKNPSKVPQRLSGELNNDILINNPLSGYGKHIPLIKKKKISIYKRITNFFKKVFKWRNKD